MKIILGLFLISSVFMGSLDSASAQTACSSAWVYQVAKICPDGNKPVQADDPTAKCPDVDASGKVISVQGADPRCQPIYRVCQTKENGFDFTATPKVIDETEIRTPNTFDGGPPQKSFCDGVIASYNSENANAGRRVKFNDKFSEPKGDAVKPSWNNPLAKVIVKYYYDCPLLVEQYPLIAKANPACGIERFAPVQKTTGFQNTRRAECGFEERLEAFRGSLEELNSKVAATFPDAGTGGAISQPVCLSCDSTLQGTDYAAAGKCLAQVVKNYLEVPTPVNIPTDARETINRNIKAILNLNAQSASATGKGFLDLQQIGTLESALK